MNAFALEHHFSWRFSNTTFLAIGFLLFLQYKMFSLKNRFWQLWQNFHLTDNSRQPASTDEGYDKLYKLRPTINVTTEQFKQVYNIGQNVCVHERMVKGKEKNL